MATNDQVVSWTDLKVIRQVKDTAPLQYVESTIKYDIWVQDGTQVYTTQIWIDTSAVTGIDITQNNIDKTDWETNYKAGSRGLSKIYVDVKNTVNANIVGGTVTIGAIVNDSNIFFSDITAINTKNEITIRTYTVPSQKTFRLVAFQANVDHPLAIDIVIYVAGVAKLKFYLDPSQGSDSNYLYTAPVIFATSGQAVTIKAEPSMSRGEINTILVGIES